MPSIGIVMVTSYPQKMQSSITRFLAYLFPICDLTSGNVQTQEQMPHELKANDKPDD